MSTLRPRVIPCLQVSGSDLVKTRRFKDPQYLGDPINAVKLFNDLDCDEIVVVDIKATLEARAPDFEFIEEFASEAFMPMAYGGGLDSVEQIRRLFSVGIEKAIINSAAATGDLVSEAAAVFGSQSVVVSIDVRKTLFGRYEVWTRSGTKNIKTDPIAYALKMEGLGAGEIFVQSIELEGTRTGYDLNLMAEISRAVSIPVIACGGAGSVEDIRSLLQSTGVSAAAAGTLFVLHGKHRAPLISYPRPEVIAALGNG